MNNDQTLINAIFGPRGSRTEINTDTVSRRQRGGTTNQEIVLSGAVRYNRITSRQKKAIETVFASTIAGKSAWSIATARALQTHSASMERPIVAELRPQGSGAHTRMVYGGRIYFDVNTAGDLAYLAKSVYDATDIFKSSKLVWTDASDQAVIKALVAGLFTRPRMSSWIRVDITEGSSTEASPRCISERALVELRAREAAKARKQQEDLEAKAVRAEKQTKFVNWARTFVPIAQAEAKREAGWAALLEEEVPDNWDD